MAFKFNKYIGLAACFAVFGGVGHAATLSNGGSVCEGPNSLLPAEAVCDSTFGDGGQTSGPTVFIDFSRNGSGTIYGGIRGLNQNRYADVFNLSGTGLYEITLTSLRYTDPDGNVVNPVSDFDADLTIGGEDIGTIGNQSESDGDQLTTIVNLSSLTEFSLDASGGQATGGNVMEYRIDITAVPLPAGMVLLLSGLGGLAFMRRRTTA